LDTIIVNNTEVTEVEKTTTTVTEGGTVVDMTETTEAENMDMVIATDRDTATGTTDIRIMMGTEGVATMTTMMNPTGSITTRAGYPIASTLFHSTITNSPTSEEDILEEAVEEDTRDVGEDTSDHHVGEDVEDIRDE